MRFALFALALCSVTSALAQEPDTTDWHRYIPLAVGNEWQYLNSGFGVPDWYVAYEIVGDSLVDGQAYFTVERCSRLDGSFPPQCGASPHLIRYDEEAAVVVERLVVGGEPRLVMWPPSADLFMDYCRLDLPFGEFHKGPECFGGKQTVIGTSGEYGVSVSIGGDTTPPGTRKGFGTGFGGTVVLSGIGVLESLFEFAGPEVVFARVGGVEYGEPAIVVSGEAAPPQAAEALTVAPNPIRDATTLRFALAAPERLTLAVYDVRGRLVRADALGVRGAGAHDVRFEARGLPPGAYRLRLLGEGGFAAARGVIVLP